MEEYKTYELTVIVDNQDGDPATYQPVLDAYHKLISNRGKIIKEEIDGVKRLAYSVKGREQGLYVYWEIVMSDKEASELSTEIYSDSSSLRYLMIPQDVR